MSAVFLRRLHVVSLCTCFLLSSRAYFPVIRHSSGFSLSRILMKRASTLSEEPETTPVKRRKSLPKAQIANEKNESESLADDEVASPSVKGKKGPPADRTSHIRDVVLPHPLREDLSHLKIMSWNVNGLNAMVNSKLDVFQRMVDKHQPDLICLQETKIQETMVPDFHNLLPAYYSYFSCSTVKKGYSGTVRQWQSCFFTCMHSNFLSSISPGNLREERDRILDIPTTDCSLISSFCCRR